MANTPDPLAAGLSTTDYCALLPRRRSNRQARGLTLKLLRTGLVVVPFREHTNIWDAVVVDGHGAYPVRLRRVRRHQRNRDSHRVAGVGADRLLARLPGSKDRFQST